MRTRGTLGHKLVDVVVVARSSRLWVSAGLAAPTCPLPITYPSLCEARHPDAIGEKPVARYCPAPPFEVVSGRSHSETWAGCIVSLTTPTRSLLNASRSVSSRSFIENSSSVLAASYFLL
jgi:hypothetical protein